MAKELSAALKDKIRVGKTAKDHKSGAWARNATNRLARGLWSNGTNKEFPTHTCNGKGNSSKPHKGIRGSKVA
jgi:hypothetical protein